MFSSEAALFYTTQFSGEGRDTVKKEKVFAASCTGSLPVWIGRLSMTSFQGSSLIHNITLVCWI